MNPGQELCARMIRRIRMTAEQDLLREIRKIKLELQICSLYGQVRDLEWEQVGELEEL